MYGLFNMLYFCFLITPALLLVLPTQTLLQRRELFYNQSFFMIGL